MDFTKIFALVLKLMAILPIIQDAFRTGGSVISIIQKLVPDLMPILQTIGLDLFPTVDPAKASQAGIDIIFDVDGTKWVQNSLNAYNKNTALVVDGSYGKATKAAVTAYQQAHMVEVNNKADGWCGPRTTASLAMALSKMPAV